MPLAHHERDFVQRLPELEPALAGHEQERDALALETIEDRAREVAGAAPRGLRRARRGARRATR